MNEAKGSGPAVTRRRVLKGAAVAAAAAVPALFHIVPRHCLGGPGNTPPSEKLNVAGVGIGGQGKNDVRNVANDPAANVVALCDVDDKFAGPVFGEYPKARRWRDYRKMLDEQKDIDAVVVATPDHLHYVISATAMKLGKHVYCEKPLAHTVAETRALAKLAKETGLATQMGNHGNAREEVRLMEEWIAAAGIGTVREVQCWTNKPVWPQGVGRPADTPPVPDTLAWDLWLGPAKERPYHPAYLPFAWRGWWDFGSCALGDMGCHVLNNPFRALHLGLPTTVEAYATKVNAETGPLASIVYYDFPARRSPAGQDLPPVRVTWYDGGIMPPRPAELERGRRMGNNEGCLFLGDKGKIVCGCYGDGVRMIPETAMQAYQRPPKSLPRSIGHFKEWIAAAKGGPKAGSNFEVAAVLTEVVQLGNVAIRASQRRSENGYETKLVWDADNMKVSNIAEANQFLRKEYRKGWEV